MDQMINERDLISMKLLHYFITKKNYNPIIVQGVENEIWLENLEEDYKVVRIVNNYIHNDEQLDFDIFKTKRMVKKIKRKTFSFNIKALSILTDVSENAEIKRDLNNITLVNIKNDQELAENETLNSIFPDLKNNLKYTEEGFQLFLKITTEINEKNRKESMANEKIFEPKKIIVNYVILGLIIAIYAIAFTFNYNETLIDKFGVKGLDIRNGEVYRLLTGAFLHVNILHLISNGYALYVVGNQIETFYGKKRMIIIYLFSAITGSLLSIAMNDRTSVGASGAIFGLMGSLLYFGYYYRVYLGSVIVNRILPVILINLIVSFSFYMIDGFAHVGGLIGGILISIALGVKGDSKHKENRVHWIVLSSIFLAFLIYLAFFMK